jgi:hypothetical protein
MDLLDGTRQFGTQKRPMKAAQMAQLARHAVATDVGIAKNATDKEKAHAGSERSPICHAFQVIRPSYALPLPGQAATLDPLSSPPPAWRDMSPGLITSLIARRLHPRWPSWLPTAKA